MCGLRRGELIALEWSDFDFSAVNGTIITKSPKTAASYRVISVPAFAMALVKQYRKEQIEYRLRLGSAWEGRTMSLFNGTANKCIPAHPTACLRR